MSRLLSAQPLKCRIAVLFMLVGFLMGCHSVSVSPVGKKVPEAKRIALAESGEVKGIYRTEDLVVEYQYSRESSRLMLTGRVRCSDRLRRNLIIVESFHLDAMFADPDGRIHKVQGLLTGMADTVILDGWATFSQVMVVPENSAFLAFSYSGRGKSEGGDANIMDFWDYPAW